MRRRAHQNIHKEVFNNSSFTEIISQLKKLQPNEGDFNSQKQHYLDCNKQITGARDLNRLSSILHNLLEKKLYPNEFIVSQLIKKLGQYKRIGYANAIYEDATSKNVANAFTHNSMIDAAGKNGQIDLAIAAYKNATDPNRYVANAVTHASMIDAAGKNGQIDFAITAYKNATDPNRYVADAVTHNSMIDAAGKNGQMDLAITAYKNATDPNRYVADAVTHNSMIDALVLNNKFTEAKEVHKKYGIKPSIINSHDGYKVDLHSFSYGSAYIALKEIFETAQKPLQIIIIYGKGLHSKNINDEHAVKKSVNQLIHDIQQAYDISFREDPNNSGQAFCRVQSKLTQEKKKTSSDPNQFFSNSKVALSATYILDPNARPFTPRKNSMNFNAAEFTPRKQVP